MKASKIALILAVTVLVLGLASTSFAFHSGGVGECEGCHTMHNSVNNATITPLTTQFKAGPYLLKANDQCSTCLNCHESTPGSYHISTYDSLISGIASSVPVQLTPGGDFAWLKKTMTGSVRKTLTTWEGEGHGHNVICADYNYDADTNLTSAPGGSYPASNLTCIACHDPHSKSRRFADGSHATTGAPIFNSGSYTNSADPISGVSAVGEYRFLGAVGYQPKSLSGSYAFTSAAPIAMAPSSFNASSTTIAGVADRVIYGAGMSEWCGNCHGSMHNDAYTTGTSGQVHPAGNGGKLTASVVTNYNQYVSSGIIGSPAANGYSSLAPFEQGSTGSTPADYAALKTFWTTPAAATTSNNVLCLSCHRAHASAFESMTRFALENEFMTVADSANAAIYDSTTTENKINYGYSDAQQVAAYNGRPATLFGPYARNYCNKCHNKD